MVNENVEKIIGELRSLQKDRKVSAFSVSDAEAGERPRIWLSWVGEGPQPGDKLAKFITDHEVPEDGLVALKKDFYFFSSNFNELRPGSGLIRVFGGKSEGPGGTLTCLLNPKSGTDIYFAAASHVLTNFWRDTSQQGSIYRYRKGFPPSGSTRFLGKTLYFTPAPERDNRLQSEHVDLDIGIVKLVDEKAETKQRTTCYGTFGELRQDECVELEEGITHVVKCGSQETHWTEAVVEVRSRAEVPIYGPDPNKPYTFHNQIILRDLTCCEARDAECPHNSEKTPFAVPGDSGTLVVEKKTKKPVGMLIAGSILDGRYVVTPFKPIRDFFDEKRLLMQRA